MSTAVFHRDALALFYAKQHLKTDAGVKRVVYLPKNSPEREIRFVEVNDLRHVRTSSWTQFLDDRPSA